MFHVVATILLVLAFTAAAVQNLRGGAKLRADYVRWGYPAWWNVVTAALEFATAALIAAPITSGLGMVIGMLIVGAAVLTLLLNREFSHLAPPGLFAVLLLCGAVKL